MRMMRILFLHGLESKPGCEKVQLLQSLGHIVQSPKIEYKDDKSYENLYKLTKHNNYDVIIGSSMGGWFADYKVTGVQTCALPIYNNYDVIIGSSMGGWFAWNLGKELGVPVLLLNPALHSRSVNPAIGEWVGEEKKASKVFLALGLADDIINPDKSIEWLNSHDKLDYNPNNTYKAIYGHRTSVERFIDIWVHFEKDIEAANELQERYAL